MKLRKENKRLIKDAYGSWPKFKKKLESVSRQFPKSEKHRIDDIIIYYNNLFTLNHALEPDVIEMRGLVLENINVFEDINKKIKSNDLMFMVRIMRFNLNYVIGGKNSATGS